MVSKEKAEEILIRLQRNSIEDRQIGIIQKAINAAIEEDRKTRECCKAEREACANIAAGYREGKHPTQIGPDGLIWFDGIPVAGAIRVLRKSEQIIERGLTDDHTRKTTQSLQPDHGGSITS